jgi:cephalosporin hydroxylase
MNKIDDDFVEQYVSDSLRHLEKPKMGGTDWRYADIIAPAFYEMLEIMNPKSMLEIGFNVGGSALMFLSIMPGLHYDSVDINECPKSARFLSTRFPNWRFFKSDSKYIRAGYDGMKEKYNSVLIDGDHTYEGVVSDLKAALSFNPEYIIFDDVRHPSHRYIESIITAVYADRLDVVRLYEFNHLWQGYSFALCKVKY